MYELPYSLILEVQAPGSRNVSGMDLGGSVNYIVNFPAFLESGVKQVKLPRALRYLTPLPRLIPTTYID